MKTLVMFSGGVDSTYVLVKLLRETDDEVFAHHVHLVNYEGRHAVEARRCRQIIEHCRRTIRPLHYTESAIDHRGFRFFGIDMISVGFEAGLVAHSHHIPRWTAGISADDQRWDARFRHVEASVAANAFPFAPPQFFLLPQVSKLDEMRYLQPDLLAMTWSCRTPVVEGDTFLACAECRACQTLARLTDELVFSI